MGCKTITKRGNTKKRNLSLPCGSNQSFVKSRNLWVLSIHNNFKDRALSFAADAPVEATRPARMTCRLSAQPGFDPDDILVAVGQEFLDEKAIAACLALPPKRIPRPAPEMGFSGFNSPMQGFRVHVGEHQNATASGIGDDGGDESRLIKARCKRPSLFKLGFV